jgi:predicted transcriptional regulator
MSVRLDNLKTERESAGLSIGRLASLATVSDLTITTLEAKGSNGLDKGGTCDEHVAQRIADALGVSLVTLGIARL